jgi:hypothetical protein
VLNRIDLNSGAVLKSKRQMHLTINNSAAGVEFVGIQDLREAFADYLQSWDHK